jgi:CheY-like chemotaxis protein
MSLPHKIFIVDDNRDAADTLGMFFENHGFEVRVAYDGDDAIREVDEFHPEVALLDIGLPGKDGYQIAQHIRAGDDAGIMIIAVSGYAARRMLPGRRTRASTCISESRRTPPPCFRKSRTACADGPRRYRTSTSSTSKTSVALGGITPPAPRDP